MQACHVGYSAWLEKRYFLPIPKCCSAPTGIAVARVLTRLFLIGASGHSESTVNSPLHIVRRYIVGTIALGKVALVAPFPLFCFSGHGPPRSNVAFSCRRACGRLGTCLRLFPLKGSPLASVIGQLQRLVGCSLVVCPHSDDLDDLLFVEDLIHQAVMDIDSP